MIWLGFKLARVSGKIRTYDANSQLWPFLRQTKSKSLMPKNILDYCFHSLQNTALQDCKQRYKINNLTTEYEDMKSWTHRNSSSYWLWYHNTPRSKQLFFFLIQQLQTLYNHVDRLQRAKLITTKTKTLLTQRHLQTRSFLVRCYTPGSNSQSILLQT